MVAQIITIVNQSGKVIKSSKTLVNVFAEARNAYNEKKAELRALRQESKGKQRVLSKEERARKQLDGLTLVDDEHAAVRRSLESSSIRRKPVPSRRERPTLDRSVTDSFYVNDELDSRSMQSDVKRKPRQASEEDVRASELVRRHTDLDHMMVTHTRPRRATRSASMDDIDMDLAYGELPPPVRITRTQDTVELREKMTTLQTLLEEANCVQHGVTAMIEKLSKNPDAMAAVALTLAEISNIAAKLAPGALTAMKGSFPAIMALLASPQFAIAAGVGVGITIIAFGSYKIIKKIQARKEDERMLLAYGDEDGTVAESMDELREIDRIEHWRRGIADAGAVSVGTSVDGELVTPIATRTLIEEGKLKESDLRSKASSRKSRRHRGKPDDTKSSRSRTKANTKSGKAKDGKSGGLRSLFKST